MATKFIQKIHDAKAGTGWGTDIDISSAEHVLLIFSTASSANLTAKIATSALQPSEVDFTSSAAVDNEWDYTDCWNMNTDSSLGDYFKGDTGIVYAGTDSVEQLLLNVDTFNTLNVNVTARSAGSVTVKAYAVNFNR